MRSSLLDQARSRAVAAGLNLFGLVDRQRYDGCEPCERRLGAINGRCGTVVVLGTGGRALAMVHDRWQREAGTPPAPTPAGTALAAAANVAALLQAHGVACTLVTFAGRHRLRAERLGEAAGFGTVSPVSGFLLHPEFGPWLRVRAALLCEGHPFGPVDDASITERFQPCCGCSRPCVAACPATVHDGRGLHDLARCGGHRHAGGCATECSTRAACPLGSQHRDAEGEQVHRHTYELAAMQRWFGLGVWRFVPKSWRGGP